MVFVRCISIMFMCVFLASYLHAGQTDDRIIVQLESDNQLLPLYLGKIINNDNELDDKYLEQLQKIMEFDLSHNGMTQLVKPSREIDMQIHKDETFTNSKFWSKAKVNYAIRLKANNRSLTCHIFQVNANVAKQIQEVKLTGVLVNDRKQVHLLADTLFKALFGKNGIASTRILYTVKIKDPQTNKFVSDVWEADYDGGNARKITNAGYCVTPVYVPPKRGLSSGSFFYVSYLNGQPKIFYASLKEGIGHRLTLLRGNQLMPAISRQRDKVAFVSDAGGNPDLFLQTFSPETGPLEKPRQIYAPRQGVQGTPTFSPDGNQIAFVSNKDGATRIYVMTIPAPGARLQDLKLQLISKQSRESSAPAWSPDGTKLAYCAMINSVRQIWVYDFESGKERQLTQGPGHKENPTWGPNSLHLIFNSTGPQGSELYLVNLNQPEAQKIHLGPGEKHYPNWEPKVVDE